MISSLVVHVSSDPDIASRVHQQLSGHARMQLGMTYGNRLPIVLDANSNAQAKTDVEWLRQLPGVEHVDVAFVQVENSDQEKSCNVTEAN